jgi:TRAP-type uncharacterized transport system fused permease subunit
VLFVLQPALILKGPLLQILQVSATAIAAVVLLAGAFEGYFYRIGNLSVWARIPLGIGGLLMLIPESITDIVGFVLGAVVLALSHLAAKRRSVPTG